MAGKKQQKKWVKHPGNAYASGLRKGGPSSKRSKQSGVPEKAYSAIVAARARKVEKGTSSFGQEGLARCHRASDKYTRDRLAAASNMLVTESSQEERTKVLRATVEYVNTLHKKEGTDPTTDRATQTVTKALTEQSQQGQSTVSEADYQAAVTRLANHASENFFMGDGPTNSAIGAHADGRDTGGGTKTRSPTPRSRAIHQAGALLDKRTGRSVSPRTRAFAKGELPGGMQTSARPK
ncbi:hypothetical protein SAMN02745781_00311 [Vibrio gazogenes DSM 21264]|uniref:Uncharacterized protein n=1 Tax=Vibrio gazogenes DSM 21264 = NBRC 103151 TaxID=1123492 RepID=A0A1M4TGC7_VIBGA|nr:hypothetical protein SAMN02745781_00311 [Vibrio gazogenes DSM 21264] [Vibrio gazogenes DSM 21264 = NBRC 103151]SJN54229.1 hypothetical protein BQ6471_00893 [Vibrio gazogenes]